MQIYFRKKLLKKIKPYGKKDNKTIEFDDTEIQEYKPHQYKIPILINNLDIDKIVASNEFAFENIIKKLDLYAYFFQKWVYIKDILIRLNVYNLS